LELRIPKLRTGSLLPSLLERRRRVDQALFAVVMEAYLHGVSTHKVDDLVKALGADTGISRARSPGSAPTWTPRSAPSETGRWPGRRPVRVPRRDILQGPGRPPRRLQAVVVATGVRADGWREMLGFAVGDSEDGAFWTAFLRSLKARGLGGVQLTGGCSSS
jgi:putative transposase